MVVESTLACTIACMFYERLGLHRNTCFISNMFYRISCKPIQTERHVIVVPRHCHASIVRFGWRVECCSSHEASQTVAKSLNISDEYLQDMVKQGHAMKDVIKVGRRGACDTLVEHIQKRWNTSNIVKLHCSGKPSNNMKQLASEIESKTQGVIIFRSGGTIILFKPVA